MNKRKIVILDGYTLNPGDLDFSVFNEFGEVTCYDRTKKEDTIDRIGDAEIIFTNKTVITKEIMDACPNLKWIGVFATGYNIIDIVAAKEKGIYVANVPAYSTKSVAQMVFAMILEICFHVADHSREVFDGEWSRCKDFSFWKYNLIELDQKTLGIIGMGSIGQEVAKLANAFGMNVLVYSRTVYKELEHDKLHFASLDEVLNNSDFISLHIPLFNETKELINKDTIAKMKDGAVIINTARGGVINEQDLSDALNSGKLSAAAVDVVSVEPIRDDNPLLKAKNLLITPHIAWAPLETRQRLLQISVNNLRSFLNGKPENIVNK